MFNIIATIALIWLILSLGITIVCLTYLWIKVLPIIDEFFNEYNEYINDNGIDIFTVLGIMNRIERNNREAHNLSSSIKSFLPTAVVNALLIFEIKHCAKKKTNY